MKTEKDESEKIPQHTEKKCQINKIKDLTPTDDEPARKNQ